MVECGRSVYSEEVISGLVDLLGFVDYGANLFFSAFAIEFGILSSELSK
ncbi:MAG: hypothetical protein ACI9CU_002170 [Polaribacter sp.]|jgi:hypothetical protein